MRLLVLSASILCISSQLAGADPVEDRQAIMKERGSIMQTLGPIAQGQQPFDAEVVMAALRQLEENTQRHDIDTLYAAGAEGGKASPRIWENMDAFKEIDTKLRADVAAAVAAAPADLDSFRAVFGTAASNCGTCHEQFRTQ